MNSRDDRVLHVSGTPHQVGLQTGQKLGEKLGWTIRHYIDSQVQYIDMEKLQLEALPWLRRLPVRFQEELEGLAEGAGLPLDLLAQWGYVEECEKRGCSGAVALVDGQAWVARNNDTYIPELWGYVGIRSVQGRLPTINFSMQGDPFAPTGVNREKLWLHYNFLEVWDAPDPGKPHLPAFVWMTDALETCTTISEVEAFLHSTCRDSGMLLFAVDGKNNEVALFECLCAQHFRRDLSDGWIVGTNHFCSIPDPTLGPEDNPLSTVNRFRRMEQMVAEWADRKPAADLPWDLVRMLADDGIERRAGRVITAYSNVACPSTGELWYTFGGYPSASRGDWQRLEWPW